MRYRNISVLIVGHLIFLSLQGKVLQKDDQKLRAAKRGGYYHFSLLPTYNHRDVTFAIILPSVTTDAYQDHVLWNMPVKCLISYMHISHLYSLVSIGNFRER